MISDVIGWKFNHQEGMRCKETDGVMTIVEFPGGIPSQADQDLWTQEYKSWVAGGGEKDAQVEAELGGDNIRILIETFLEIIQNGSINTDTPDDVVALAKSKRRNEL